MMTERCGRNFDLALSEGGIDLIPDLLVGFDQRAGVDRPTVECERRFGRDQTRRSHLLGPEAVVRGDNELRIGKMCFQELAEFVAMPHVDGHNHIVEKRERKLIPEQALHESEVKAYAHAVLVSFAMIRAGREKSALIEVDIEIELPLTRGELRGKFALVVFVDR